MKKKLATMAIAGLAVTAFAACGDDDGDDSPSDTGDTETEDTTMDTSMMTMDTSMMTTGTTAGG